MPPRHAAPLGSIAGGIGKYREIEWARGERSERESAAARYKTGCSRIVSEKHVSNAKWSKTYWLAT